MNVNIKITGGRKNEDGYSFCETCREKLVFRDIWEVCFCIRCKEEKECYAGYYCCEDCREYERSECNEF